MVNARAIGMGVALLAGAGAVLALGGRGSSSSGTIIATGTMNGYEVAIAGGEYGSVAAYRDEQGYVTVVGGISQINTAPDGTVTCLEIETTAPSKAALEAGGTVSLGDGKTLHIDSMSSTERLPKTLLGGSTNVHDCPTGMERQFQDFVEEGQEAKSTVTVDEFTSGRRLTSGGTTDMVTLNNAALVTNLEEDGIVIGTLGFTTFWGVCETSDSYWAKHNTNKMPSNLKLITSTHIKPSYGKFTRTANARILISYSGAQTIIHTNAQTQSLGVGQDGHHTMAAYLNTPQYRHSPLDGHYRYYNNSFLKDLDLTKSCILQRYTVLEKYGYYIDYQVGFSMGGAVVNMFRATTGKISVNGIRSIASPKPVLNEKYVMGTGFVPNLGCSNPGIRFLKSQDVITGDMGGISVHYEHDTSKARECSTICYQRGCVKNQDPVPAHMQKAKEHFTPQAANLCYNPGCLVGKVTCEARINPEKKNGQITLVGNTVDSTVGCHAKGKGCETGNTDLIWVKNESGLLWGFIDYGYDADYVVPTTAATDVPRILCVRSGGSHHKTYALFFKNTYVAHAYLWGKAGLANNQAGEHRCHIGGSWVKCADQYYDLLKGAGAKGNIWGVLTMGAYRQLGYGDTSDDWNNATNSADSDQGELNCPTAALSKLICAQQAANQD